MDNTPFKLLAVEEVYETLGFPDEALSMEFALESVNSGAQCLQLAHTLIPDLILLPVGIAGMDGFELYSRLRQAPAAADIPVVFVAGSADDEMESKVLGVGALDYLIAPTDRRLAWIRIRNHAQRARQCRNLRQQRDRLELALASRTADLVAARDEALRLASVKSQFLANMNHQIRTPLHGVLAFADLGFRNEASDEKAREYFAKVIEAARQLQRVASDIGVVAMFESSKLNLERVSVDVRRVINETVRTFEAQSREKQLNLLTEISPSVPQYVNGDPVRVRQILGALLSNAIKFSESGEVKTTVDYDGHRLALKVSDKGVGMSEEQIARFFQPYGQADTSLTRNYGNSGFGLLVVKRIVDAMSGEIRINGKLGQGSQVEVFLPLAVGASADEW